MRNDSQTSIETLSSGWEEAGIVKTCLWFFGADLLSPRFAWALQEQQMGKPMEKPGVCCLMLTLWPDGKLFSSAFKHRSNGDEVISWGRTGGNSLGFISCAEWGEWSTYQLSLLSASSAQQILGLQQDWASSSAVFPRNLTWAFLCWNHIGFSGST